MLILFTVIVVMPITAAIVLWAYHAGRTAGNPIPTMYPRDMWAGLTGSSKPDKNGEKDDEDDDEAESKRPQRVRA